MTKTIFNFPFFEKNIRKMTFGILSTVDSKGNPHSTGIIYAVAPKGSKFCLYCITSKHYKKVQNIQANSKIAFIIPFPHHFMRFVPANVIHFQGTAEIIPKDNDEIRKAFQANRILKFNMKETKKAREDFVFIKLKPEKKILSYGLGYGMFELRKDHAAGANSITIPEELS